MVTQFITLQQNVPQQAYLDTILIEDDVWRQLLKHGGRKVMDGVTAQL